MAKSKVRPTYQLNFSEKQALNSDYKIKLRKKATESELKLMALLKKAGYKAMFQKGFLKDYFCIVDFYIPLLKLVIEVDGGYHTDLNQIKKDKRRDDYLTKDRGFSVLRLTNDQVDALDVKSLKSLIEKSGKHKSTDVIAPASGLSRYEMKEKIESLKTSKGGYNKKDLVALGVNWPPVQGWKDFLINSCPA